MLSLPGWNKFAGQCRYFGVLAGLKGISYRALRRATTLRIDHIVTIQSSRLSSADHEQFEYRFLNANDVRRFASEPDNDLEEKIASRLDQGYDLCFAALSGGQLVNYSWYAIDSIEGEHCSGIPASFSPWIAYFYKAYTLPKYRGLGINQTCLRHAFAELYERGVNRIFGLVELDNYASLQSCEAAGFRRIGHLVSIGRGAASRSWQSNESKQLGIRIGKDAIVTRR